nr:MAG: YopX protein [Bacteriophage sp.]
MIEQEKEFKYKGRRILDNKWVYGAYMKQGNNHFIIPKVNKNGYAKCIAVDPNSVSKYDEKGELNG